MDSSYEILCISINHGTTPLEVRERIAFRESEVPTFLSTLAESAKLSEVALLSTCNRTELFSVYESNATTLDRAAAKLAALAHARDFTPVHSPQNYHVCRNFDAVKHLFRVAAGLESQILGESQILRQVRRAGELAQEHGSSGKLLQRLWQRAVRVGKRVRTETGLGEGALSASYAGIQLARKVFGSLADRKVLVIGAGEIGVLTLENLMGADTKTTIVNRSVERAQELATRFGASIQEFDQLDEALVDADIVISSTGAQEPIVDFARMRAVRSRRQNDRPLLIVDLAIPRDFDPRCGTLDLVFLKNLDDLQEVVDQNLERRQSQLPLAESIVEIECTTYFDWLEVQALEPMILALRERYEGIRSEELEKLRGRVDDDVFDELDRLTRRLINRILHTPTSNLRRHEGIRDEDVHRVVHEVLTQEIPHPRSTDSDTPEA